MLDQINLALIRFAVITDSSNKKVDDQLKKLIGDITTWSLLACVLAVVVAAVIWAWGSQSQNAAQATQGKKGVLVAIAAAAVIVGASALVEWGMGFGTAIK